MSALAEALLAAQRSAIGALSKQYVAGTMDVPEFCEWLDVMGCRDVIEQGQILAALNALKQFGVATPDANGTKPTPETEPASERQLSYLKDLADSRNVIAPDGPLTKEQASKAIEELKAGTYNADAWSIPF